MTPEVTQGLSMMAYHLLDTPDHKGRPVMNIYCKGLSWEGVSIQAAQHCMIFMCWRQLSMFGYTGQIGGITAWPCTWRAYGALDDQDGVRDLLYQSDAANASDEDRCRLHAR